MSKQGYTVVLKSWVEVTEPGSQPGMTVTRFSPGGDVHQTAIVQAVFHSWDADSAKIAEQLDGLVGQPVSVLMIVGNMLGAPLLAVQEGKVFKARDDRLAILPKGARKHGGTYLDPDKILEVRAGYGHTDELADLVDAARAKLPQTVELTKERLAQLPAPGDTREEVTLAVFGTWHGPDGGIPGAVWLIESYDPEYDICDGVLLIGPGATSESGSIYGRELMRMGGEVVGFQPITFAAAIDLIDFPIEQTVAGLAASAA